MCSGFSQTKFDLAAKSTKVKNLGPEDQALVCPWKGLLAIVGVETQNSGLIISMGYKTEIREF